MKFLIFILLATVSVTFYSCEKSSDGLDKDQLIDLRDDEKGENGDCLELVYPVSYLMPDGSSVTGNAAEELKTAIAAWYDAHPDSEGKPFIQYPVNVLFKGKNLSIGNEAEMIKVKKICASEKNKEKPCFQLVYPITYLMPDGTSVTGDDEKALNQAIKSWYEAHPDSAVKHSLQYPVDVIFKDKTITISDEEGMKKLKASCK